jgi:hypothetical protein
VPLHTLCHQFTCIVTTHSLDHDALYITASCSHIAFQYIYLSCTPNKPTRKCTRRALSNSTIACMCMRAIFIAHPSSPVHRNNTSTRSRSRSSSTDSDTSKYNKQHAIALDAYCCLVCDWIRSLMYGKKWLPYNAWSSGRFQSSPLTRPRQRSYSCQSTPLSGTDQTAMHCIDTVVLIAPYLAAQTLLDHKGF